MASFRYKGDGTARGARRKRGMAGLSYKPEELKYKRKSLGLCLYDCIVICTNNKRFDCKKLFKDANLVLDTCNATEGIESENIYHL